jgi:LysR family transcriptional regulator, glycine cleavage system transcriptional activator
MVPDLESLRCFEAAASHLSFRVAARAVALSPAAFGERIKRLEETVGAPLFTRTTRRVALTAAGSRLLPQARRTLDEARRCLEVAAGDGAPLPYDLVIGTRFELGLSWLAPSLGALAEARPERTLHLHFSDSDALVQRVQHGTIDAAVTSARLAVPDLEIAVIHPEAYVFVGAARLLRRQPLRGPGDAAAHTLLDAAADLPLFRYFQDGLPRGAWWRFGRVISLGTIAAVRLRVREGGGVAVLPRYFVAEDLRRRTLLPLVPRVKPGSDMFRLVWRAGHPRTAELHTLADELRRVPLR